MHHRFTPKNTCSTQIGFDLEGDVVRNVRFEKGCDGNLQALGKLVEGFTVEQLDEKLRGIHCGGRPTSCADQLCMAVRQAYDKENATTDSAP